MRRWVGYARGAAVAFAIVVGIGAALLLDDDTSSRSALPDAVSYDVDGASDFTRAWAMRHRRSDEVIPNQGCGVGWETQLFHGSPFRYDCLVTYRNDSGRYRDYEPERYRGYSLRLVQSAPGKPFRIVRVRPREAGTRAYD